MGSRVVSRVGSMRALTYAASDASKEDVSGDHEWKYDEGVVQTEALGEADHPHHAAADDEDERDVEDPCARRAEGGRRMRVHKGGW